jgi:hypothetical protein
VPERNLKSRMRESAPPSAAALRAVLEFKFLSGKMAGMQSMSTSAATGVVSNGPEPISARRRHARRK